MLQIKTVTVCKIDKYTQERNFNGPTLLPVFVHQWQVKMNGYRCSLSKKNNVKYEKICDFKKVFGEFSIVGNNRGSHYMKLCFQTGVMRER